LAVFPRCSLLTYQSQDTLVARVLKNSQLTGGETYTYFGDRTLGTWLLVLPSFLGFSAMSAIDLNTLLIAIFVVVCSGSALSVGIGGKPAPK
jgi:hypothetical protein